MSPFPFRGKDRMGVGQSTLNPIPTLPLPLKGRELKSNVCNE